MPTYTVSRADHRQIFRCDVESCGIDAHRLTLDLLSSQHTQETVKDRFEGFPCYCGLPEMMFVSVLTVLATQGFALPMLGDYPTLLAFIVPYILSCTFFAITLSSLIYRREDKPRMFPSDRLHI